MSFKAKPKSIVQDFGFIDEYNAAVKGGDLPDNLLAWMDLFASLEQAIKMGDDVWLRIGPDRNRTTILVTRYEGRAAAGYAKGGDFSTLTASLDEL